MFQLGLLLKQDPRRSKKYLMDWLKRFGLIQEIWANSNAGHSNLGPKKDEGVLNLIQAIEGWFGLIGLDLWRGLMAN